MLRLCLAVHLFGLFLLDCEENAIAVCIVPFINLMIFYIHNCTSSYYVHTKQRFMSHLFTFNLSTSILYHFFIYCIWVKRTQIHANDMYIK